MIKSEDFLKHIEKNLCEHGEVKLQVGFMLTQIAVLINQQVNYLEQISKDIETLVERGNT